MFHLDKKYQTLGFSVIPQLNWMIYQFLELKSRVASQNIETKLSTQISKSSNSQADQIENAFNIKVNNILNHMLNFTNDLSIKHSNHYPISGSNGILAVTIPLEKGGKDALWQDKRISYDHNWIKEHKNALQTAYGKSPFFEYYDYKLFQIFDSKPTFLCELNTQILLMILPYLGWSDILKTNYNSDNYHNTMESFEIPAYTQVFDTKFGFQPQVCILDLLFNLGPLSNDYFKKL